ncbi:hypothetical protein AB1K91_17640 [Terribacillus sp. 179-K 1B1 HS]
MIAHIFVSAALLVGIFGGTWALCDYAMKSIGADESWRAKARRKRK